MIKSSEFYKAAVTADARRALLKAAIEIIDPDIQYESSDSNGEESFSKSAQLWNRETKPSSKYATLEPERWILDGSFTLIPDDPTTLSGEVGFVGNSMSRSDGTFETPVWAELQFSNVSILQALSVFFSTEVYDGVPEDFTIEVKQYGTAYFTQEFTGNTKTSISLTGFTVQNPDAIRITVTKWSLPGRRFRLMEIIPGLYEEWTEDMIAKFGVTQKGDVSCLSVPFGTCTLEMDNLDRRFEPRRTDGVFQSIEERQGININIGINSGGNTEYKKVGVFYQHSGGWRTGNNGITMQWRLVDIVGLLVDREYILPDVLPTTLSGWITSLVAQLGENFVKRYRVDENYADLSCTANVEDVLGMKCGDVLRYVCMATGTWPRADAETGYLTAEPMWNEGNKLDLDNMTAYPTMKGNEDVGALVFNIYDEDETQIVFPGTSMASSKTVTVNNPFIHTAEQARTAARNILSTYGGNKLETTGRGDPSSEIGDVDTVWLDESRATTGRRIYQTFNIQDGVLRNCASTLLQANGAALYEESVVLTEDGTWTAPAGVSRLFVAIGQGGQGGMRGEDGVLRETERWGVNADTGNWGEQGSYEAREGKQGESGFGGKVWFGTIDINEQQVFPVHIGAGGKASDTYGVMGEEGEETTFGAYTSAAGKIYSFGYTDISSGSSYGRTGVQTPLAGTADGASGGKGGEAGIGGWSVATTVIPGSGRKIYYSYWDPKKPAGKGKPAKDGASGFVLIYWDKEGNA